MIIAGVGAERGLGHARPVDPGRDMGPIADLIEIAFGGELERTGNNLVAELRHLATLGPLLTFADRVASYPAGYVWEQDGKLIGNATLSIEDSSARLWFVSNVAVHPDYRGQGIGRRLMEAALEAVRQRGGRQVLLQVRTDNEPAQRLYRGLGFTRFDTVAEMIRPSSLPAPRATQMDLRRLGYRDWAMQLDLAQAATPSEVLQVRALDEQTFRPSLLRRAQEWLDGLVNGRRTMRWGLQRDGMLVAVVSVLASDGALARLDLTVRPGYRGPLEAPLTDAGLMALDDWRPRAVGATVSTTHPEALQALRSRHFVTLRTLDQLVYRLE